MKLAKTVAFGLVLGLGSAAWADDAPAPAPALPDTDYVYDAVWAGMPGGQVEVALKPEGAAGCYRYTSVARPTAMVKMLYGSANQASLFCLKDGRIRSHHFETVVSGNDKLSYHLDFDWDKHSVDDGAGQVREIPDDAIDSLALEQAVRLWVIAHAGDAAAPVAEFTMVDHKNLTHYQFKLNGHEQVQTPAGTFDALVMERVDNPNKLGRFWIAPELGYTLVKSQTRSGSVGVVEMTLVKK